MYWSSRILGTGLAKELQSRVTIPVLKIGADSFTKGQLSRIDCFSFIAAGNLNRVLSSLSVKNTKDLFERVSPSELALPRLGAVSLAVLGAAFEVKGLGGERPIESWMLRHQDGELRTFTTVKNIVKRDEADQRQEAKTAAKRSAGRKAQAHEIRVERHMKRAGANGSA